MMYREVVKVNAKSRKEAVVNLLDALRDAMRSGGCDQFQLRICVPDENGDIEESQLIKNFFAEN